MGHIVREPALRSQTPPWLPGQMSQSVIPCDMVVFEVQRIARSEVTVTVHACVFGFFRQSFLISKVTSGCPYPFLHKNTLDEKEGVDKR